MQNKNGKPRPEKKERPTYLAYIGTTKIAFLKAYVRHQNQIEVAALSARLADGFEGGIVKDLAQASQMLNQAVADIIPPAEKSIILCRLVVSNVYLKHYTFQSSVYFHGNPHPIGLRDVRAAIAQTRSVATIPLQEVIVQAVPQEFLVNDLEGVQNPIGLEASRLGVTLRLLTLDFLVYNNLLRVFERCDLEVTDIVPNVLAASHSVLTPSEKQTGVILVTLGGAVTHFACFKNSVLLETRSIAMGADCITKVIEKNLNIEHLDAQRLKESFGSAKPKAEFHDELIPIPESNGKKKYTIRRREFESQMSSGLNLFFGELQREIRALEGQYSPLNHVVFTGGGSSLDGLLDVARELISPTARIGVVQNILGPEALIKDPAFSGALGGISFTSKVSDQGLPSPGHPNWVTRTVDAAKNWIFEYL